MSVVDTVRIGAGLAGLSCAFELDGLVFRHRTVSLPHDFLSWGPGHLADRSLQRTPVPGLVLVGDYTRQRILSSMEGAVVSGFLATRIARAP